MSDNLCLRYTIEELEKAGVPYRVDDTRTHLHVCFGPGFKHLRVVSRTPSDWRAPMNERTGIRRQLRELGFLTETEPTTDIVAVKLSDGKLICTSVDVAAHFERKHKNVLQAIDQVRDECGEEFDRLNFKPISYLDAGNRSYRAYEMTRDGFSLVVMGFTGQAATKWKVRYIEAFNAMQTELQRLPGPQEVQAIRADLDAMLDLMSAIPGPTRARNNGWLVRANERRRRSGRYIASMGAA